MKTAHHGFTLIEGMIVAAILGIVAAVVLPLIGLTKSDHPKHDYIYTIGGIVEAQCIGGYKFLASGTGSVTQILDEFGKGVRCEPAYTATNK